MPVRTRLTKTAAGGSSGGGKRALVGSALLVAAALLAVARLQSPPPQPDGALLRATTASLPSSSQEAEAEAVLMRQWRASGEAECKTLLASTKKFDSAEALEKKEALDRSLLSKMTFNPAPPSTTSTASRDAPYRVCKNAFIDLGTNIGDSIGYFVDNAVDVCSPLWADKDRQVKLNEAFPRPHLDVAALQFTHLGSKPNPLFGLLQRNMKTKGPTKGGSSSAEAEAAAAGGPETFCVYGMEGNPTFTERLTNLENFILNMRPRPVAHLHIFTESVVTATDGPTKLYLDKTSVKENFWGSSILSSQQDAVKTAKELNDGSVVSADVNGITLTTMVRSTMLALGEVASPQDKTGGLLIIKMDVEGAEYQVLKEVAASDVLCELVRMGNRVVLVVEYHNMSITDPAERTREKAGFSEAKNKLKNCGVEFEKLHGSWH